MKNGNLKSPITQDYANYILFNFPDTYAACLWEIRSGKVSNV